MPRKVRRKSNDSRYFEMLWTGIGSVLALQLDEPFGIPCFILGCTLLAWLYLDYIDDNSSIKRSMSMKDIQNLRMFEYKRGEEFSVTLVVDDNSIVCYTEQKLPANCDQDVALAFFEEAEVAAEVYLMREANDAKTKTH